MKSITMLILICMTFLFANINTFESNDKKMKEDSFQKMIQHIEKIRRLLRNLEEDDTDASENSGDDKNSENDESGSESSEESGSGSESSEESGLGSESSEESGSPSESSEESGSGSESSEESGSGSESSEESGSPSESSEESGSPSESSKESGSPSESSEESGSGSESSEESGSPSESSKESGSGSESSEESGSPSESSKDSGSSSESSPESGSPSESGNSPSSSKSSSSAGSSKSSQSSKSSGTSSGSSKSSGSSSGQSGKSSEGNSTSSSASSSSSGQNTNTITTLPASPVSVVDRTKRITLVNFNSFYAPPLFVYLTFNSVFRYINVRPARIVTFTITIVYYGFFRNLEEEKEIAENTTATCVIDPEDEDKINGTCNYKCQAPKQNTTNSIVQIAGSPDFLFDNKSTTLDEEGLTFSEEASVAFNNLQNQTFVVDKSAVLNDGEYTINGNKYFTLKGTIDPNYYQGKVGKDSLYIKFVDSNKEIINIPCTTQSIFNNTEYEFRCTPSSNLNGTLHLSQLYDNDTDKNEVTAITLNMRERYNDITYQTNGNNTNSGSTTKFNQAKYRKNSSGLSGGAIAGIVIACIVVLIIGSIIAMMLRRPKAPMDNSTSIVGLRTVDNYSE